MAIELSPIQARIIGVLLEKQTTTPDQYPLSLNALTLGCNQKSNRDPVLELSEAQVQDALTELESDRLVRAEHGSRVSRYQHRFCNTEFGSLKFTEQQRALVCLLLLRGPQTPGELRTRSNRLANFSQVSEVESCLQSLIAFDGGALVQMLPREPGKRESRYQHLLGDALPTTVEVEAGVTEPLAAESSLAQEVAALRLEVSQLRSELAQVKEQLSALQ